MIRFQTIDSMVKDFLNIIQLKETILSWSINSNRNYYDVKYVLLLQKKISTSKNVLKIVAIWFLIWISQIFYIFGLVQNIWQFETSTLGLEVIIRFLWSPYEKILAYASKKEECNFYDNVIAVKERRLIADINRSCI